MADTLGAMSSSSDPDAVPVEAAAADASTDAGEPAVRRASTLTAAEREDLLAENRRTREELVADQSRVPGKVVAPDGGSGGRAVVIALSAVVAALLIAVGVLSYFVATADEGDGPGTDIGTQALTDAREYAALVVTYAPGEFADLDRRIREISTPEFADRYIASSQDARRGTDEAKAASVGTGVAAGLESIDDEQAVVLVALNQKITSPDLPSAGEDGLAYQTRVRVSLQRDGDRWLLSDLVTL